MTTLLFVLSIYAAIAGLVAYARRDRFTGAATVAARRHGPGARSFGSSSREARRGRARHTSRQASQCIC
jgi:hypothetical protein